MSLHYEKLKGIYKINQNLWGMLNGETERLKIWSEESYFPNPHGQEINLAD